MSYILDALKKSDKERKRAAVPGVLTVQDIWPQRTKRRAWWPYLLLAALVLNAGLLVWWMNPLQSKKTSVTEHATVHEYRDSLQTAGAGMAMREKQAVPKEDVQQPKREPVAAPIVQKPPLDAEMTAMRKNVVSVPQVETGKPKEPEASKPLKTEIPAQNKVVSPARLKTEKPLEAAVPKPQLPPVISQSPTESEPAVQSATPVDNRVYSLVDLPASVQKSLPAFTISAHVYSSDPASRMVKINGQTMRQGDDLIAGLRLEEIAPDGVIFRYQNYRFRIGLR
jgi:general secretion pathway protein B